MSARVPLPILGLAITASLLLGTIVGYMFAGDLTSAPVEDQRGGWPTTIGEGDTHHSAVAEAFGLAEQAAGKGAFRQAHDAVLHAMVSDASDERVFARTLRLTEQLLQTGDEQALDVAEDLLGRLDLIIPHQSLQELPQLRDQLEKAWVAFEQQTVPPSSRTEPSLLAELEADLELIADERAPAPLRLALVRQAASTRDSVAVSALAEAQVEPGELARQWHRYTERLEAAEAQVLREMFEQRLEEFKAEERELAGFARSLTQALDQPDDLDALGDWRGRNEQTRAYGRKLRRWERELHGYVEDGVAEGAELVTVQHAQARLAWAYSRASLDWTRMVDKQPLTETGWQLNWWPRGTNVDEERFERLLDRLERPVTKPAVEYAQTHREDAPAQSEAMVKLLMLNLIDADLLIAYAGQQYEAAWQKSVENLDEEGRALAARLRLTGGLP